MTCKDRLFLSRDYSCLNEYAPSNFNYRRNLPILLSGCSCLREFAPAILLWNDYSWMSACVLDFTHFYRCLTLIECVLIQFYDDDCMTLSGHVGLKILLCLHCD